jgi:hypothetical protein
VNDFLLSKTLKEVCEKRWGFIGRMVRGKVDLNV